ncbi:MAG: hypothetical protein AAB759_02300 [Patescibacteria group bacterium]
MSLDSCGCGTWGEPGGCAVRRFEISGKGWLPRIPFQGMRTYDRCPLCYVLSGGVHHLGCMAERCPDGCEEQFVVCRHGEVIRGIPADAELTEI